MRFIVDTKNQDQGCANCLTDGAKVDCKFCRRGRRSSRRMDCFGEVRSIAGCVENMLLSSQLYMNQSKVLTESVSVKPHSVWLSEMSSSSAKEPDQKAHLAACGPQAAVSP